MQEGKLLKYSKNVLLDLSGKVKFAEDTLIPFNLSAELSEQETNLLFDILKELEKHEDINKNKSLYSLLLQYLELKLKPDKIDDIAENLTGEQLYAIALGIRNFESNNHRKGVIIGDTMGFGKTRIAAGYVQYFINRRNAPFFVCSKEVLLSEIINEYIEINKSKFYDANGKFDIKKARKFKLLLFNERKNIDVLYKKGKEYVSETIYSSDINDLKNFVEDVLNDELLRKFILLFNLFNFSGNKNLSKEIKNYNKNLAKYYTDKNKVRDSKKEEGHKYYYFKMLFSVGYILQDDINFVKNKRLFYVNNKEELVDVLDYLSDIIEDFENKYNEAKKRFFEILVNNGFIGIGTTYSQLRTDFSANDLYINVDLSNFYKKDNFKVKFKNKDNKTLKSILFNLTSIFTNVIYDESHNIAGAETIGKTTTNFLYHNFHPYLNLIAFESLLYSLDIKKYELTKPILQEKLKNDEKNRFSTLIEALNTTKFIYVSISKTFTNLLPENDNQNDDNKKEFLWFLNDALKSDYISLSNDFISNKFSAFMSATFVKNNGIIMPILSLFTDIGTFPNKMMYFMSFDTKMFNSENAIYFKQYLPKYLTKRGYYINRQFELVTPQYEPINYIINKNQKENVNDIYKRFINHFKLLKSKKYIMENIYSYFLLKNVIDVYNFKNSTEGYFIDIFRENLVNVNSILTSVNTSDYGNFKKLFIKTIIDISNFCEDISIIEKAFGKKIDDSIVNNDVLYDMLNNDNEFDYKLRCTFIIIQFGAIKYGLNNSEIKIITLIDDSIYQNTSGFNIWKRIDELIGVKEEDNFFTSNGFQIFKKYKEAKDFILETKGNDINNDNNDSISYKINFEYTIDEIFQPYTEKRYENILKFYEDNNTYFNLYAYANTDHLLAVRRLIASNIISMFTKFNFGRFNNSLVKNFITAIKTVDITHKSIEILEGNKNEKLDWIPKNNDGYKLIVSYDHTFDNYSKVILNSYEGKKVKNDVRYLFDAIEKDNNVFKNIAYQINLNFVVDDYEKLLNKYKDIILEKYIEYSKDKQLPNVDRAFQIIDKTYSSLFTTENEFSGFPNDKLFCLKGQYSIYKNLQYLYQEYLINKDIDYNIPFQPYDYINNTLKNYFRQKGIKFNMLDGTGRRYKFEQIQGDSEGYGYIIKTGEILADSDESEDDIDDIDENESILTTKDIESDEEIESSETESEDENVYVAVSKDENYIINLREKIHLFNNDNQYNLIIINRRASESVSLHASEKFKDRRPRVMIIAEAESNSINEIQKRGRINRRGQVAKPYYYYPYTTIPYEKRIIMMLKKKLIHLEGVTKGNRNLSDFSEEELRKLQDLENEDANKILVDILQKKLSDSSLPLFDLHLSDMRDLFALIQDNETGRDERRFNNRIASGKGLITKFMQNYYVFDFETQETILNSLIESYFNIIKDVVEEKPIKANIESRDVFYYSNYNRYYDYNNENLNNTLIEIPEIKYSLTYREKNNKINYANIYIDAIKYLSNVDEDKKIINQYIAFLKYVTKENESVVQDEVLANVLDVDSLYEDLYYYHEKLMQGVNINIKYAFILLKAFNIFASSLNKKTYINLLRGFYYKLYKTHILGLYEKVIEMFSQFNQRQNLISQIDYFSNLQLFKQNVELLLNIPEIDKYQDGDEYFEEQISKIEGKYHLIKDENGEEFKLYVLESNEGESNVPVIMQLDKKIVDLIIYLSDVNRAYLYYKKIVAHIYESMNREGSEISKNISDKLKKDILDIIVNNKHDYYNNNIDIHLRKVKNEIYHNALCNVLVKKMYLQEANKVETKIFKDGISLIQKINTNLYKKLYKAWEKVFNKLDNENNNINDVIRKMYFGKDITQDEYLKLDKKEVAKFEKYQSEVKKSLISYTKYLFDKAVKHYEDNLLKDKDENTNVNFHLYQKIDLKELVDYVIDYMSNSEYVLTNEIVNVVEKEAYIEENYDKFVKLPKNLKDLYIKEIRYGNIEMLIDNIMMRNPIYTSVHEFNNFSLMYPAFMFLTTNYNDIKFTSIFNIIYNLKGTTVSGNPSNAVMFITNMKERQFKLVIAFLDKVVSDNEVTILKQDFSKIFFDMQNKLDIDSVKEYDVYSKDKEIEKALDVYEKIESENKVQVVANNIFYTLNDKFIDANLKSKTFLIGEGIFSQPLTGIIINATSEGGIDEETPVLNINIPIKIDNITDIINNIN
ncbi:MAG: hypothetical protein KatS3mg096_598 [Candidatus Parcubacteria bacterium]|nr:MAG: hypothetical protein KatS3mg096_598 [Candidatus Parcubacteria bacterium]